MHTTALGVKERQLKRFSAFTADRKVLAERCAGGFITADWMALGSTRNIMTEALYIYWVGNVRRSQCFEEIQNWSNRFSFLFHFIFRQIILYFTVLATSSERWNFACLTTRLANRLSSACLHSNDVRCFHCLQSTSSGLSAGFAVSKAERCAWLATRLFLLTCAGYGLICCLSQIFCWRG